MLSFLYTRIRKDTTIHTCQILLVEADSPQDAFEYVASQLTEGTPRWADWHEADYSNLGSLNFSGRWSGEVFLTPEQRKKAHNKEAVDLSGNPNYLRFSDDPALADEVIAEFIGYRLYNIEAIKQTLRKDYPTLDLFTHDHRPYGEQDFTKSMGFYYIKKLTDLYYGEWTPDTGIYDLHAFDTNLSSFLERVAKAPERQFLIPVDFHH